MCCYPKHSSMHNECVQQVLLLMCVDNPSTLFVVVVFTSLMRLDVFVVGFFLCGNQQILFLTSSCSAPVFVHVKATEEMVMCCCSLVLICPSACPLYFLGGKNPEKRFVKVKISFLAKAKSVHHPVSVRLQESTFESQLVTSIWIFINNSTSCYSNRHLVAPILVFLKKQKPKTISKKHSALSDPGIKPILWKGVVIPLKHSTIQYKAAYTACSRAQ